MGNNWLKVNNIQVKNLLLMDRKHSSFKQKLVSRKSYNLKST